MPEQRSKDTQRTRIYDLLVTARISTFVRVRAGRSSRKLLQVFVLLGISVLTGCTTGRATAPQEAEFVSIFDAHVRNGDWNEYHIVA